MEAWPTVEINLVLRTVDGNGKWKQLTITITQELELIKSKNCTSSLNFLNYYFITYYVLLRKIISQSPECYNSPIWNLCTFLFLVIGSLPWRTLYKIKSFSVPNKMPIFILYACFLLRIQTAAVPHIPRPINREILSNRKQCIAKLKLLPPLIHSLWT